MQERKLEVRDRGKRKAGLKEAKKGINMYADKRSVMYQRRSVKKNEKEMKENEVERKERTKRNGKEGRMEYRKKERNCYHALGSRLGHLRLPVKGHCKFTSTPAWFVGFWHSLTPGIQTSKFSGTLKVCPAEKFF